MENKSVLPTCNCLSLNLINEELYKLRHLCLLVRSSQEYSSTFPVLKVCRHNYKGLHRRHILQFSNTTACYKISKHIHFLIFQSQRKCVILMFLTVMKHEKNYCGRKVNLHILTFLTTLLQTNRLCRSIQTFIVCTPLKMFHKRRPPPPE